MYNLPQGTDQLSRYYAIVVYIPKQNIVIN